ncbi:MULTISPECIES: helix-turn-helix domain-containing protein [Rodentibacter]|uniref:helix-turn-helix domain-containing protein n=1 Tax=Rodentibacter TaxID=1960084 RepID=UPI00109431E7|nr:MULTISPECIES: helix-turn-helix domain-containing protein [Pasteurellaceae]MCR1838323.1 IclR family transcriptional regulator [Pasteurella caecimuris]MCU0107566.1 IclR family transcriptional regulator [Pasteurella caecimuris]NBH76250.1 IclR family transcriptional regulator [Rodentibacter pneumotropicus]TGY49606.1 IclR family transcriptional regulator [Pasteurella caecimuris]THA07161.1 IclR family transcriptional regulator [Rodentibacter pneumotropicus]
MKEKINSTQRALRILKALKGRTIYGLSNKELSEAIDDSPVNVSRATAILAEEGFLRKLPTGNWTMSFAMLNLAVAYEQDMQAIHERVNEVRQRVASGGF